jgi:uncharacterized protein (DUF58 family)
MALEDTAKRACTVGLAAALATACSNTGCTRALWCLGDRTRRLGNDTERPPGWAPLRFAASRNAGETLMADPPPLRRNGIRVLLSDLLWPGDPGPVVRRLTDRAAACFVVQILAQAENEQPAHGNTRLEDVETGERLELFVDATARKRYAEALEAHRLQWLDACRGCGVRTLTLVAEPLVADWDLQELQQLSLLGVA